MLSPSLGRRESFPSGKLHLNKINWSCDLNIFFLDAIPALFDRFIEPKVTHYARNGPSISSQR